MIPDTPTPKLTILGPNEVVDKQLPNENIKQSIISKLRKWWNTTDQTDADINSISKLEINDGDAIVFSKEITGHEEVIIVIYAAKTNIKYEILRITHPASESEFYNIMKSFLNTNQIGGRKSRRRRSKHRHIRKSNRRKRKTVRK